MNKDVRRLVRAAESAGWRTEQAGGHLKIYPRDRRFRPIVVGSGGNRRGVDNLRADLRRAGLDV